MFLRACDSEHIKTAVSACGDVTYGFSTDFEFYRWWLVSVFAISVASAVDGHLSRIVRVPVTYSKCSGFISRVGNCYEVLWFSSFATGGF